MSEVWEAIEAVVSHTELHAALALVTESVPPPGAGDPDDWRAELVGRYPAVGVTPGGDRRLGRAGGTRLRRWWRELRATRSQVLGLLARRRGRGGS